MVGCWFTAPGTRTKFGRSIIGINSSTKPVRQARRSSTGTCGDPHARSADVPSPA